MDSDIIEKINLVVLKQFPYLKEVQPEISSIDENLNLFIYKGEVQTVNNQSLPIIVRIVADHSGEIKKISTSR